MSMSDVYVYGGASGQALTLVTSGTGSAGGVADGVLIG
jgi:hypothetical protein